MKKLNRAIVVRFENQDHVQQYEITQYEKPDELIHDIGWDEILSIVNSRLETAERECKRQFLMHTLRKL